MRGSAVTSKESAKRIIVDKILLVFTALLIGMILISLMILSDRYMLLTREWMLFLGGFITYNGTTCYLLWGERRRRLNSASRRFAAIVLVQGPMLLLFGLIYSGVIPAPPSMLPYWFGTLLIAPVGVESIRFLFRP
jgi:hypothetical protein